ncbi:hypothetical protein [Pseudonocardia sp. GCM10023141]|uniref:hypothetical protein n=1 Tax=Pseudonocardia sp. GCM10023141 TaxID=3252653 RepID=UPI0036213CF8
MSSHPTGSRPFPVVMVLAPGLMLAGVALMPAPGTWNLSHLLFLAGTLLMAPAGLVLWRLLDGGGPPWLRHSGLLLVLLGVPALAGQLLIDLVVLQLAGGDRTGMGPLFRAIQASPTFDLLLYSSGPALLFVGLALSGAALLLRGGAPRLPGWALITGTLVMGAARVTDQHLAEIAGLAVILVALAAVAAPTRVRDRQLA